MKRLGTDQRKRLAQLDEGLFVDVLIGKARLLPHESKLAWDEHLAINPQAH